MRRVVRRVEPAAAGGWSQRLAVGQQAYYGEWEVVEGVVTVSGHLEVHRDGAADRLGGPLPRELRGGTARRAT